MDKIKKFILKLINDCLFTIHGGWLIWIIHFRIETEWKNVVLDYDNNAKYIGGLAFSYAHFARLLFYKKSFRNVFIYRLGKANICKIWIHMSRLIFPPCEGIFLAGEIEGGIRLNHNYMVISVDCAGMDFVVQQGVTIAGLEKGIKPSFGDDVYVGANALVLGACNIGNHVKIGAGTVIINENIPDNVTVVGNPFRIISKD